MPKTAEKAPCPQCGGLLSRVLESRHVQRLRECQACGTRWLTEEVFKRVVKPKKAA